MPLTATGRPLRSAARFHPACTADPISIRCAPTLSAQCLRIVASAATGPMRSVQKVLLMKVSCATSMTLRVPITAAIG